MARISKRPLDEKMSAEIWQQLYETVGRLSSDQATTFLTDLLGPTEQTMLAKRLAAIVLIHEEHSDYAIAQTLQMSSATVHKLRLRYQQGRYDEVIKGVQKNKTDYIAFVDTLIDAIHFGLPRYAGPNRWKLLKQ
jgi:uncharacterized protein YerC